MKHRGFEGQRNRWGWLLLLLAFGAASQAAGLQVLHGHVPAVVARLQPIGRLPGTTNLNLAIGLPLRNQAELHDLLRQIADPASPQYRHYLTPEQFTERFGPTEQDYQTVMDFMTAHGLTVTGQHPNRVVLDVRGTVADIERVLHVTLREYRHPTGARTFFAPDSEPLLNLAVPVLDVSGLSNYAVPHPKHLIHKPAGPSPNATPNAGSGPGGAYTGSDFRTAYLPGVTWDGTGQAVGLLEFDGYYSSDITTYENQTGLPHVTLANVLLDGFNGVPTTGANSGNSEVALDIEMAISMAPGLTKVIVYEAGPNGLANDILSRMVSDNQAKQLSCSWSFGVTGPDATADQLFQQMAAQGQSFFNAAGDNDAFVGSTAGEFPSDDPYITQAGGTTLTTDGSGAYVAETVWNWGYVARSGYVGTGGGVSTIYSIPSWQQGVSMSANQGSTTMRNIPDVAMVADNIAIVADNGQQETFGGTSFSAPLWAGLTALANQLAVANGQATVGFINPALYAIGQSTDYRANFHDITTGNNEWPSSPSQFSAVAGYDLCTGWGTPAGANLITTLAGISGSSPSLAITSPTDYEIFTNASVTVTGTASDISGLARVTVNGVGALLSGTNWSAANTLSRGTNTVTVIAVDNSLSRNATTQTVHAVYSTVLITANPTVTGALVQIGDVAAVVDGETNTFGVSAVDTRGATLNYQWVFGDGTSNGWSSSATTAHAYSTNCGPYTATVTVSDGLSAMTSNLTVVVACQLTVTRLQVKLNFAQPDADRISFSGTLDLGANFNVAARMVTLDVGGAQVSFTLDAKGRGVSAYGNCRLLYNKRMTLWTLQTNLAKGDWQTAWAADGLNNTTVRRPGIPVMLPVVVLIGGEAFADERSMIYTAQLNKSGSAK